MKNIGINEPCSEDWDGMTPTQQGAYCKKCATTVHDFTGKSGEEIRQTLRSLIGQPVCGRITTEQEAALNAEFEAWAMQSKRSVQSAFLFSLLVIFGLTLFSCSHEQDRKKIERIRDTAIKAMQQPVEELPQPEKKERIISPPLPVAVVVKEEALSTVEFQEAPEDYGIEVKAERDDYTSGGMSITRIYQNYLIETVPVIPEYDENGNPYPLAFDAITFPNPTAGETTFELKAPLTTSAGINLFDMNGRLVQVIHSGDIERGTFRKSLNLTDLLPGIYLITIYSKDFKETVRVSKI